MKTTEERKEALAKYLDIDVDSIKEVDYADNRFSITDGDHEDEEYLVVDEDEAYDEEKEYILDIFDDLGVFGTLGDSNYSLISGFIDEDFFEDFFRESIENDVSYLEDDEVIEEAKSYDIETEDLDIEDIRDALISAKLDSIDDFIEEYYYDYGSKDMDQTFKHNSDAIDLEGLAEKCIELDGVGHNIAGYDGKEIELDNDLYAYRVN